MLYDQKKVERLKERYPEGTRIQLIAMSGESDMPSGLMGIVDFVDDISQLQMKLDQSCNSAADDYAKEILKQMHNLFVEVYGTDYLDSDYEFIDLPAVLCKTKRLVKT